MDYLTKQEAEERLRFAPEEAGFCPDCMEQLRKIRDEDTGRDVLYCPNEMCLNETQYEL